MKDTAKHLMILFYYYFPSLLFIFSSESCDKKGFFKELIILLQILIPIALTQMGCVSVRRTDGKILAKCDYERVKPKAVGPI